jgi:hypothetical protein
MNSPIPTGERLQEIRDADTAAGESLQMAPRVWQERRDLLAYVDHLTRLVVQREAEVDAAMPANAWGLPNGDINLIPGWEPADPTGCVRLHIRVVG